MDASAVGRRGAVVTTLNPVQNNQLFHIFMVGELALAFLGKDKTLTTSAAHRRVL